MRSRVYETVERPSVCPPVCLSHRLRRVHISVGPYAVELMCGMQRSAATPGTVQRGYLERCLELVS